MAFMCVWFTICHLFVCVLSAGRLVLADALTYTQKHFNGVDTVFDYATLTGACVTALGSAFAGMWCNDDHVASTVNDAALSTSAERVWRMPWEEFTKELEHPVGESVLCCFMSTLSQLDIA